MVDAVFQHGDALDADAEGQARIAFRVDAAVLQNLPVYHAAAQNFNPAGFWNSSSDFIHGPVRTFPDFVFMG